MTYLKERKEIARTLLKHLKIARKDASKVILKDIESLVNCKVSCDFRDMQVTKLYTIHSGAYCYALELINKLFYINRNSSVFYNVMKIHREYLAIKLAKQA